MSPLNGSSLRSLILSVMAASCFLGYSQIARAADGAPMKINPVPLSDNAAQPLTEGDLGAATVLESPESEQDAAQAAGVPGHLKNATEKRRRAELAREAFYKRAREEKLKAQNPDAVEPTLPEPVYDSVTTESKAPLMPEYSELSDPVEEFSGPVMPETGMKDHDEAMRAAAQKQLDATPVTQTPPPAEMAGATESEPPAAPPSSHEASASSEFHDKDLQKAAPGDRSEAQSPPRIHDQNLSESAASKTLHESPSEANFSALSRLHARPITGRWETPAGADMQQTLEIWSREAGVGFSWKSPERFTVRDTIVLEGTFESAVALLLQQYDMQLDRPVGNLHINPETGQRVLIVDALMQ